MVDTLHLLIQVDIYGACGTLKNCTRKEEIACWDIVEHDYFFYLSFENSLCKDYITEKFFHAYKRNIVPVVLGGALDDKENSSDYINGLGTPPHSFIDARQHSSPKSLAKYLNELYASPQLYAEYFWWKDHYNVTFDPAQVTTKTYCDICRHLHEKSGDEESNHKVIRDLQEFWDDRSRCQRARIQNK